MKKRILMALLTAMTAVSIAACSSEETAGDNVQESPEGNASESAVEDAGEDTGASDQENAAEAAQENASGGSDILVAYFTYAENADLPEDVDASAGASIQVWEGDITGNTGAAAHMISETLGADLFSIQTVEKYPDNYDDTIDQGQEEQRRAVRPELASQAGDISRYTTVFLGYPNWWGDMPMAVYSFLDEYDLSGKTVIPFVTSGGSGFSGTVSEIERLEPEADVQEGIALSASGAVNARDEIEAWLSDTGYVQ